MRKIAAFVLILSAALLMLGCTVFADNTAKHGSGDADTENAAVSEIIDEYAKLYGDGITRGINSLDGAEIEKVVPGFSAGEIIADVAKGKNIFSIRGIYDRGVSLLAGEVRQTAKIAAFILALSVLCTYLTNIRANLGGGASETAFFVCYTVIAGIAAAAFLDVIQCCRSVTENISVFMRVIVPVVMAGLVSSGAVVSATSFEALLIGVIEVTEWIIETLFIPLLMMAAAMNIVNNLSERLQADKLVQLMNKAVKWGLGILLTVFVGITGLQGIAAGSADGLTVKVTKFAASNLIPVVGGILSESVETVMNCSVVIKNSVGVTGIVLVILIAVMPLMKVAACLIMFRLCAAVIQPVSDKKIVKCISELADSVSCVFSMITAVTVMFVIILTIVINIGNTTLLLGR